MNIDRIKSNMNIDRIESNAPDIATSSWICRKKDAYNCKARANTLFEEQEYRLYHLMKSNFNFNFYFYQD